MNRPVG